MVSDEEIVAAIETLLRQLDFAASGVDIVQQLENDLGVNLYQKRAFILDHVNLIVQSKHQAHHHHQQYLLHHPQLQPQFHSLHHQKQHQQQQQQQQQRSHHHHASVHVSAPAATAGITTAYPPRCEELVAMPSFDPKMGFPCTAKVEIPQPSVAPEISKDSLAQVQTSTPAGGKRRGGPGGLNKLCGVSPELEVIVGEPSMTRTQIVKQLWAYIRKNNLQDPSNKRKIICNDELRLVFETDCTDMFKMNKLLAKHIFPLEPTKSGPDPKRLKASYFESPAQAASSGSAPVLMSDALAKFFGNGTREILQSDAMKSVWNYIQMNQLEDPLNSVIICDFKLRELFNCDKFVMRSLPELLSQHFLQR